ncbi:disulfide bond formation protein DsbA [Thioalkalivibrio denitrificans]|uniref:2-hydroxychromene-2-carboxylate isomerase n=1 Tax=Thioalkalivibrio denitrificans TaxID=108003 RepID=A0A1V3NCU5_9GAMM|nr:disulfide bond formation protein DsbA [Thioalkalivibrio denitrificans]
MQAHCDPTDTVEIWFDFASNYSHISVMRVEDLAHRCGVTVVWRPFLLGPIFKEMGWETSPFVVYESMGRYMWRDMERQCAKYDVPWKKPSVFPRSSTLPTRIALLGSDEPWIGEFCREVMRMNFLHDLEIDDAVAMQSLLNRLGLAGEQLIRQAKQAESKNVLRQQIERARELGIFGAPTFFRGREMFWGNDRLDDAIAFVAQRRAVSE